ncbi:MAG: hypothetical protein COW70_07150 [Hydrogenophilales bacterium CG18_big_fil_WC_8_21_14_2_50_58_12]|nr:MAG: hypothetical protein COW70_07150 [Hydrogenophilales bacterium CG18_big_fil_WC_8_21_14_2_50_58_12]
MWLSRVELKNFKSYRQQVFQFPQPGEGRNLVLIGGVNGYGKTTLLEALYVGLYGEEAVNHKALDRAGLKAKSYGHFLETAFYKMALSEGQDRMEVGVEFSRNDGGALRVTRKWFFDGKGKYRDQKVVVETLSSGTWRFRDEDELPDLLEGYATPPWLAPFFFFDGEKIADLADEDRTGWIRNGLENLLGVVLVQELRQQLTDYVARKMRDAGGIDEARVDELKRKLDEEARKLAAIVTEQEALRQQLIEKRNERERLTTRLKDMAQGSDARTVAEVAEAQSRAEQAEEKSWRRLREIFSGALPLQLIRRDLYGALEETLAAEARLTEWEQSKDQMQPRWEQFRDTFFKSDWLRVISQLPGARDSLERTLAEAWDSLFNPRPDSCATAIWHDYLQTQERRKLVDMREQGKLSAEELRQALENHKTTEAEKWRLQQELIRLQGVDGENKAEEIDSLTQQLQATQEKLDILGRELGAKDNEHKALQGDINSQTATYERERKKLVEGHPERVAAREAERVIGMIDDLLLDVFNLKLQALSEAATRIFRALHEKDQVASIKIACDGRATLFSREGTEINLPKSHGESKLFVMALVGALAEVTGYRVPLIVDTPLASLSKAHCDNLLRYWTSDPERQVILLAQDMEIGDQSRLAASITKSYLLTHQQIGHGVGRTDAVENKYFGDMP